MSIYKPERRAFGRRLTNDHAYVRIPGRPVLHCTIKNYSPAGAFLDFGREVWLPYSFKLTFEADGREQECEVRHRQGQFVGVVFQKKDKGDSDKGEMLKVNDVAPWIATGHGRR